jgi:hypothetical protein
MRFCTVVLAAALVVAAAPLAAAQADRPLTPLELAAGCAPPPALGAPDAPPRILGGQDTTPKQLFGPRDLLVIDAGTNAGLGVGQRFFVRRANTFGMGYGGVPDGGVTTLGWIQIVAVNDTTAIGSVDQACDGIVAGDYLQPFTAPTLPSDADRDDRRGDPDFTSLARVVVGSDDRAAAGIGDFMLIDRGTEHGMAPGTRFAVYRDLRVGKMPLASIGEGVVIAAGGSVSVTRITSARDAVLAGDYVAIRK